MIDRFAVFAALGLAAVVTPTPGRAAELVPPASQRFGPAEVEEVPDFQRHVLPMMGRLGCNGRACHGSFQGAGGFRLSLFGYDFKTDHEALLKDGSQRVDRDTPEVSKLLQKPTLAIPHKGGKRMDEESWQYRLLYRWIEGGAKTVVNPVDFEKLEVVPSEIVFAQPGAQVQLQVIAHWADGSREDVTCISRFRSNDESIAEIDADGLVTSKGKGDTHIVAFYDNGVTATQTLLPVSDQVGPKYPDVPAPTKIDRLVIEKLRKLGIVPSELNTDAEFLRRLSIDMTGTLPTPAEIEAFLADSSPEKRARKIDELLERPSYAAWWTSRLCDITGDNPRFMGGQIGREEMSINWYKWIYKRVKDNTPYDELIAGIVLASSRSPGQSYEEFAKQESSYNRPKDPADYSERATMPYYWGRRNLNTPDTRALSFSYTFLGVRLECAQCHKHPFDQWTQDDFKQFTAFFNPIAYGIAPDGRKDAQKLREELGLKDKKANELQVAMRELLKEGKPILWQEVFINPNGMPARRAGQKVQPVKGSRVVTPKLLGGEEVALAERNDPRAPLMDWLRSKDNPYFARAFINRVWAVYFGSGIINAPDDMNLANPPSNPALLDYLAEEFINRKFDMKWLHREIALSATYQRDWRSNETNVQDERNFSRAVVRRLPAEVFIDAVALATAGSSEVARASTAIDDRAIGPKASFAGGGRRSNYAAQVFGRSSRETNCDCNTSNEPNLLQSIYLQNDFEVGAAIGRRGGWVDERLGLSVKPRLAAQLTEAQGIVVRSKTIANLEKQIEMLNEGDNAPQVAKLETQLQKLRAEQTARQQKLKELEADGPITAPPPFTVDEVVREAYERTLGRRPTSPEADVARDYFRQAGDEAKGLRDLLWALLNTKEFVSNH